MKIKLLLLILILILTSCTNQTTSDTEGNSEINTSSESYSNTENTINNILDTSLPIEILNISEIKNANIINVAWKDRDNIFFISRTFSQVKQDTGDLSAYPLEVYRYDYKEKSMVKIFEYFSKEDFPYLYIQVQSNGDIALKHTEGFTILSSESYKVKSEIKMPSSDYVNYNISYDTSKIAIAYAEEKRLEILDIGNDLNVIKTMKIEDVGYIQAPLWTMNGEAVLLFAPKHEFVDTVAVYKLNDDKMYQYDFSEYISDYDNEAFLVNDGTCVYRTDSKGDINEVKIIIHEYNLDTEKMESWEFDSPMPMYSKTISEKGYMIGQVYHDYHQTYIGDLNNRIIVKTENAKYGGTKYSPVWAENQEEAIILYTLGGEQQSGFSWGAAIIDVKNITDRKG